MISCIKKKEIESCLGPYIKINSKCIGYLHIDRSFDKERKEERKKEREKERRKASNQSSKQVKKVAT